MGVRDRAEHRDDRARHPQPGALRPGDAGPDRPLGAAGAALAVAKGGRLVLARGYGLAFIEEDRPVQPDSLFRIASVSKPITAAAVLKLVEQGHLALDQPGLPAARPPGAAAGCPARSAHLDRHHPPSAPAQRRLGPEQSFDPHGTHGPGGGTGARRFEPVRPETVVRVMLGRPLDFDPGQPLRLLQLRLRRARPGDREGRPASRTRISSGRRSWRRSASRGCGSAGRMPDQMAEGEVRYYDPGARTIAPGNFWSSGNTRDAAAAGSPRRSTWSASRAPWTGWARLHC